MAKRVNNAAQYGLAERMFVEDRMNANAIANALGVTPQTIGRWRKGIGKNAENWDEKRKKFLTTPHNVKKMLSNELARLAEGKEPTLDMKAINDVLKGLETVKKETSPEMIYLVLKDLDRFISQIDPEFANECTIFHKQFLLKCIGEEN